MPTWRARGSQPSSVTLRVAPSSAPSSVAERLERVVLVGRDAAADADHHRGLGERVEIVVAGAGEHPDASASDTSPCAARAGSIATARGAGAVIIPARTVAIWIGDVAPIAATSWPPNARLPRDEPSVVDLEVDRVAGEPGVEPGRDTRRDLAAPRGRTGDDRPRRRRSRPSRRPRARRLPRRCARRAATTSSAPHAASTAGCGLSTVIATTRPSISAARRAAAPSSSRVACARSGSAITAIAGPRASARTGGTVSRRSSSGDVAQRAALAERAHRVAHLFGERRVRDARPAPGSPP